MNILVPTNTPTWKAHAYAQRRDADPLVHDLVDLYWETAAWAGVRADVAFCQMLKETGFLKFGRAVTIDMRNPCGLKVRDPGADDAQDSHATFPTWAVGVSAHIDHLALYAGHRRYPAKHTADPRHFAWLHGRAPTVEELGGKWAPSKYYGSDIVGMVQDLVAVR